MSEQRATEPSSPESESRHPGSLEPGSLQPESPHPESPHGGRPELLWRHLAGEQLREIRRSRGETLRHVAKRADVSPQYLSEVERGRKEPSSEILAAIAGSLDTTLLDLTLRVANRLHEDAAAAYSSSSRGDFRLAA